MTPHSTAGRDVPPNPLISLDPDKDFCPFYPHARRTWRRSRPTEPGCDPGDWLISPLEGEMAGRPEGGAVPQTRLPLGGERRIAIRPLHHASHGPPLRRGGTVSADLILPRSRGRGTTKWWRGRLGANDQRMWMPLPYRPSSRGRASGTRDPDRGPVRSRAVDANGHHCRRSGFRIRFAARNDGLSVWRGTPSRPTH